uniref:THAP-type domain-containing protein n=1 Tax=Periophthalmus magnuspinnatus TaxID=409849 RepID=A0A3B4A3E0_9GOBI
MVHRANSGLSFYRLPRDPARGGRWVAAINRKTWRPRLWASNSRLCSRHFVGGHICRCFFFVVLS